MSESGNVGDTLTLLLIVRIGQRNCGEKGLGVGMQRMIEQLIGICKLYHLAVVHNADTVGEVLNDAQVMSDEHDGKTHAVAQVVHQVDDLCLDGNVKCADRLVGDDEIGAQNDCARAGRRRIRADNALHVRGQGQPG